MTSLPPSGQAGSEPFRLGFQLGLRASANGLHTLDPRHRADQRSLLLALAGDPRGPRQGDRGPLPRWWELLHAATDGGAHAERAGELIAFAAEARALWPQFYERGVCFPWIAEGPEAVRAVRGAGSAAVLGRLCCDDRPEVHGPALEALAGIDSWPASTVSGLVHPLNGAGRPWSFIGRLLADHVEFLDPAGQVELLRGWLQPSPVRRHLDAAVLRALSGEYAAAIVATVSAGARPVVRRDLAQRCVDLGVAGEAREELAADGDPVVRQVLRGERRYTGAGGYSVPTEVSVADMKKVRVAVARHGGPYLRAAQQWGWVLRMLADVEALPHEHLEATALADLRVLLFVGHARWPGVGRGWFAGDDLTFVLRRHLRLGSPGGYVATRAFEQLAMSYVRRAGGNSDFGNRDLDRWLDAHGL